jgi:hypothetical protein
MGETVPAPPTDRWGHSERGKFGYTQQTSAVAWYGRMPLMIRQRALVAIAGVLLLPPLVVGSLWAQELAEARAALAGHDTAGAVRILERAVGEASLSPDVLGPLFLLDWIGRSPTQDAAAATARTIRARLLSTRTPSGHDQAPYRRADEAAQLVLRAWAGAGRSPDLDSLAAGIQGHLPEVAAAARWVRAWQLLQRLDRAARNVPPIRADRYTKATPSKESQLATVLSAEPAASALEQLVRLFASLERGPEPFNSLGARAHVAVCALLLGAPAAGCWPPPDRLVGRDSAEAAAMINVFQGRHALAGRVMDGTPAWFTPLDEQRDLLDVPDSVLRVDTAWVGMTVFTSRWVPVPGPSAVTVLPPDVYWRLAWPLYLQPSNERLVVHRGRLLLADAVRRLAVNGDPLFAPVGDPDRIVRTGVPLAVVPLIPWGSSSDRATSTRVYVPLTTRETTPGPETLSLPWAPIDLALAATDRVHSGLPNTGFVSEEYRTLGAVGHQLVHYVRAGRRHVDVHTAWTPPGLFDFCTRPRAVLGLIRLDSTLQEQHRDVRTDLREHSQRVRFGATLDAGTYFYSLELLDSGCRRAGRSRYWIKVPPADGAFLSDLMLADTLFPMDTSRVAVRVAGGPAATMSTSSGVRAGTPVRLYWEVYGITVSAADAHRMAVTVAVVDTKRQRVPVNELAALADQARRTPGALELKYDLTVPPGDDPLGCGIVIEMPTNAQGLYVARVTVTDTRTGRAAAAERAFVVRR